MGARIHGSLRLGSILSQTFVSVNLTIIYADYDIQEIQGDRLRSIQIQDFK